MIQLVDTRENATLFTKPQVVEMAFKQLPLIHDYWICRSSVQPKDGIHYFVGVVREQTTNRIVGYLYQE